MLGFLNDSMGDFAVIPQNDVLCDVNIIENGAGLLRLLVVELDHLTVLSQDHAFFEIKLLVLFPVSGGLRLVAKQSDKPIPKTRLFRWSGGCHFASFTVRPRVFLSKKRFCFALFLFFLLFQSVWLSHHYGLFSFLNKAAYWSLLFLLLIPCGKQFGFIFQNFLLPEQLHKVPPAKTRTGHPGRTDSACLRYSEK